MKVNSFYVEFDGLARSDWIQLRRDLVELLKAHDIGIVSFETGVCNEQQLYWVSPEEC